MAEGTGRRPDADEISEAIREAARIVVGKWWRGRPPQGMDFDDLRQEVILRALPRLDRYAHGGRYTLAEYAYYAAYSALMDLARLNVRRWRACDPAARSGVST
ncbi:MAG: hypothetical protein N3A38_11740 [Planctomycetota bacterium]|nr:hypothetical protein [Planctomycetota bacterium]